MRKLLDKNDKQEENQLSLPIVFLMTKQNNFRVSHIIIFVTSVHSPIY